MTKIEQLTQTATALTDDQIDGLIAYAAYLAGEPFYYSAPAEVLVSIERGVADHAAGRVVDGETLFADTARRIANARA